MEDFDYYDDDRIDYFGIEEEFVENEDLNQKEDDIQDFFDFDVKFC